MKKQIAIVKEHIKVNWKWYVTVGVTVIVTTSITYLVMRDPNNKVNVKVVGDVIHAGGDVIKKQINNNTTTFGGYQQKIVQRLEDGRIFGSVSEAAEAAGVNLVEMSRHLNGHKDHIRDVHYQIIALGTRP